MIIIRNLNLAFGEQALFSDISCTIQGTDRIGLFGLNGSGKSTLLKIVAGGHQYDSGTINIGKGKKIAYFPQEVVLASDKSIIEQTMTAFGELQAMQQQAADIEKQLAIDSSDMTLVDQYAQLCQQIQLYQPEQKRAAAQRVLNGLGFSTMQFDQPVKNLSVGWKMRVVLATLLLQEADFYLFDEPTNHLDIVAKEWFLDFIEQSSFGFILVCHEKRFLNRLCTQIMELERAKATFYAGDYDAYIRQKDESLVRLEAAYQQQQRELKQMQATIERFRASASKAAMAQSMIKKMEKIERISMPPNSRSITFQFPSLEQSGRVVLVVKNVAHQFGEKQIFNQVSYIIERGNKVAIVAANGVGKTTLLNIITGRFPVQVGSVEFGYKTSTAVFDQDQTASLNLSQTVFENAAYDTGMISEQAIRGMLGSFLFSSKATNKKASVLSGGERNRLGMVRVLLRNANMLLLDEPTNHLDIPSKDVLLRALQAYQGTILFVSHDHDFVNELASHIIELTPTGAIIYHGNYDEYIYQKKVAATQAAPSDNIEQSKKKSEPVSATNMHDVHKKVRSIEHRIEKMEKQIADLEVSFANLVYGSEAFHAASTKLHTLKSEHAQLLQEWEQLHG